EALPACGSHAASAGAAPADLVLVKPASGWVALTGAAGSIGSLDEVRQAVPDGSGAAGPADAGSRTDGAGPAAAVASATAPMVRATRARSPISRAACSSAHRSTPY